MLEPGIVSVPSMTSNKAKPSQANSRIDEDLEYAMDAASRAVREAGLVVAAARTGLGV